MPLLRVTVDTNVLDDDKLAKIRAAIQGLDVELAWVTVTERELEGSGHVLPSIGDAALNETGVFDESSFDQSVFGSAIRDTATVGQWVLGVTQIGDESTEKLHDDILAIVSNNTFPTKKSRAPLSPGHIRQLRDTMILVAHAREKRDIFVTDDMKGFFRGDKGRRKRQELENRCSTRIMTTREFCDYCTEKRQLESLE